MYLLVCIYVRTFMYVHEYYCEKLFDISFSTVRVDMGPPAARARMCTGITLLNTSNSFSKSCNTQCVKCNMDIPYKSFFFFFNVR